MSAFQGDNDALHSHLLSVQNKMFDFYKKEKLTDVTWIVGSENDEINAHSSICAMSNHLKMLLETHSSNGNKKVIRISPNMTGSADEFKSLLSLAYTGCLEKNRSITDYLELCERFDMPIGSTMCSRALQDFFIQSLLQTTINIDQQKVLQQVFRETFEKTSSMEAHQAGLNMFRMHPLLFNIPSCLSKIPLDWILKVIEEKTLWVQSPEGYIFFGRSYLTEVKKLLNNICAVHNVDPISVEFDPEESMLAPICIGDLHTQGFGFHSYAHNYNFSVRPGNNSSFDNFPPNEWKVCSVTGHITRSWDDRQVVAGLDITYQNLITGEKSEALWGHADEKLYTRKTIDVPEDDVIIGIIINSGWLIDKLVFTTLRGMHLNALGGSDGGNRTVIQPSNFWRGETPNENDRILVAFHGIKYINVNSKGQILMNQLTFHFSCVNQDTVIKLNPGQKEFVKRILRKKIIL